MMKIGRETLVEALLHDLRGFGYRSLRRQDVEAAVERVVVRGEEPVGIIDHFVLNTWQEMQRWSGGLELLEEV